MIATICALTTQLSLPASEARAAVDAHFAQQLAKLERHDAELLSLSIVQLLERIPENKPNPTPVSPEA